MKYLKFQSRILFTVNILWIETFKHLYLCNYLTIHCCLLLLDKKAKYQDMLQSLHLLDIVLL